VEYVGRFRYYVQFRLRSVVYMTPLLAWITRVTPPGGQKNTNFTMSREVWIQHGLMFSDG